MSLADLVAIKEKIESPHGDFEVQGLTLEALAGLLKEHTKEIASLFDGKLDFTELLKESPVLVAKLIAYSAGEPEHIDNVKSLPFGVQLIALQKIWELTAVDTAELGNMIRSLTEGMENLDLPAPATKK